jgi:hypothetical protein
MSNFNFVLEYDTQADAVDSSGYHCVDHLSERTAADLFDLVRNSPRTFWARWYREGVKGDRAEYWRTDEAA